ncbi:MAG TPA: peptidoglycan DD-metalloendopeptidase family protein [Vicinamibacterales bacterium]|nr:peptidoglycan DD-metalloendopeptidase family protein [Vicinamibacterales bacterium]
MHTCIRAFLCFLAFPPLATAQQTERARAEALAARAGARMDALHREADRLASQERTLLGDLRQLELERQIKLEERRQLDAEATDVERELLTLTDRLEKLQADESTARPDLEKRLVEIYKLGQARYARLLLSTSDLRRIGQAARTAAVLAQIDRDRVASHQRLLTELQSSRAALEERGRRLEKLRADARRAEAEVVRAAQTRSDAIASIDHQRDLNAKLAGELLAAQQKLQAELRVVAGGQAPSVQAHLPIQVFQSDLDWPTSGAVRRRFERPEAGRPASNGIEIVAVEGADVTAVHDGMVAFADAFSGFGNLVILDHGAQAFSLYGNLLDITVKKGARVTAGQPVGTVGASLSGLASLYFELRVDGQPVDPLQWLKKR